MKNLIIVVIFIASVVNSYEGEEINQRGKRQAIGYAINHYGSVGIPIYAQPYRYSGPELTVSPATSYQIGGSPQPMAPPPVVQYPPQYLPPVIQSPIIQLLSSLLGNLVVGALTGDGDVAQV